MELRLIAADPSAVDTECLVTIALDHGNQKTPAPKLAGKNAAAEQAIAGLAASGEVTGKTGDAALLHNPQGMKAKRLLIVGAGPATAFDQAELRKAAGTALRFLKAHAIRNCAFALPELGSGPEEAVRAVVEGAYVADFDPDTYRSDRKDQTMKEVVVVAPQGADANRLQRALDQACIVGESQNFTRALVNEPSNRLTPTMLADRARRMCESVGLKCEIMGPDKIKQMKMGAFWSVAQGSDEEPRLIVMRYEPQG